ncbi:MAG: hypothetical protein LLG44_09305 [Chloroflexi bacterium]|nr:hypothetical protein [Chloroflexota bacterium]
MNAKLPTPSLTWDWHFAAFGVRPRLTISWAFACGLVAAGALQVGQNVSVVLLVAAWLVADPLFGAITTHLLSLRELRNQVRAQPPATDAFGNVVLEFDNAQPHPHRAATFLRNLVSDLRTYPGLTGHSLSALATAVACLIMSVFISQYATTTVGIGLLLLAWVAILTGDKSVMLADSSAGVQAAMSFLLAAIVMDALTPRLVLLAVLLGAGAALRPAWLRTNQLGLHIAVLVVWLGIVGYLLYSRQPVPAVLIACAAIADHLCLKDNPELAGGYILTQLPWQISILLASLAASQWV